MFVQTISMQRHAANLRLHRLAQSKRTPAAASSAGVELQTGEYLWREFSRKVSGEWEGVTTSFSPNGSPVPLPEYYVPQAFRDWEVQLFDWQTQCSSLAEPNGAFFNKVRKLMPTVGCEADAVAFTEDVQQALTATGRTSHPLPITADGNYSIGPAALDPQLATCRIEACIALPEDVTRERLRIVNHLYHDADSNLWKLQMVDLYHERYDAEFNSGQDLRSCGFKMKNISEQPKPAAAALDPRHWTATATLCLYADDGVSWMISPTPRADKTDTSITLLLPMEAWTRVATDAQCVTIESGVLFAKSTGSTVVKRSYHNGSNVEVVLQNRTLMQGGL